MKEELISFETAKLAKEKGLPQNGLLENVWLENAEYSFKNMVGNVSINWAEEQNYRNYDAIYEQPTQSLLQKWLREVHDINIVISKAREEEKICWIYSTKGIPIQNFCWDRFETYELALEAGLQEALKLI